MAAQSLSSDMKKAKFLAVAVGVAAAVLMCIGSASAQEKPKEAEGPTYPIGEPDMLQDIDAKLKAMQASGEMAKKQKEAIDRATHTAQYPKPVAGLGKVTRAKTYYFDPSIIATKQINDATGKQVVAAGTKVNPLDYVGLDEWLLFFDATDPKQVALAEKVGEKFAWAIKPILVDGGPMDLMRKWKRKVYFDQGGSLVKKLGIQNVPALVSQEGKVLRIDELTD